MTRVIDLSDAERALVTEILRAHLPDRTKIWVFGSRSDGTARRYSDLDLAVDAGSALPWPVLGGLREALSESDLPFPVDVLDVHATDPSFLSRIERGMVPLVA